LAAVTVTRTKVFEYVVEIDRGGRMTVPGGAQLERPEGWSPDHLLLAALVRCSIDSLVHHARRAGHEAEVAGSAEGTVTKRDSDGRYAFVSIRVSLDVRLSPRADDHTELIARAERDCFVGASLTIPPDYTWRVA
jgi:organic hydroperoxide reductase OsmC/OhrA